jgi:hypothetical protein
MQLHNECYSVTGSASFLYLKALTARGSFSVAAAPMDTYLKKLEVASCQGNIPLYVLLGNDATTQKFLEQVKACALRKLCILWL